ncbi:MAG: PilT/PilU family type 4a pilus ATPase, partial [Deltaproteobacteria bacterium]|nr:PilT/PilU family type 4a pilus ATPase [Deltaproteobacteria bacterium]
GLGRFRINLFRSRTGNQAVMRVIPARIPTIKELGLPKVIEKIVEERRGLVLVTGAAGQGKSTTLAAIADQINRVRACHIITIEDPIEYMIIDRKSLITQREVGSDVTTFQDGLRSALRQDPDVIIVGEARDRETIETALIAAETGHLVLSTMHTIDARETVNRVTSVFTESEREYARLLLASVLKAVISQRLVVRSDDKGRVPAVEVMLATGRIKDLLKTQEGTDDLHEAVSQGHQQYGMQTFDQSLMQLYREERITLDMAMEFCSNPADFALRVEGISNQAGSSLDSLQNEKSRRGKLEI